VLRNGFGESSMADVAPLRLSANHSYSPEKTLLRGRRRRGPKEAKEGKPTGQTVSETMSILKFVILDTKFLVVVASLT
jgi:hypothetical protein